MTGRKLIIEKYGERTIWAIDDFIDHAATAAYLVNLDQRDEIVYNLALEAVISRLGEAAKRMGTQFISDHPELSLRKIVDNRNLVAHDYDMIEHDVITAALEDKLPSVVAGLRRLLD